MNVPPIARARRAFDARAHAAWSRELRLPSSIVRDLCFRLVRRGLLDENVHGFHVRGDAEEMTFQAVSDAIDRDPRVQAMVDDQPRAE